MVVLVEVIVVVGGRAGPSLPPPPPRRRRRRPVTMAGAHACGPSRRRFFVFQPFDSPKTKGVGHPTTPRETHRAFCTAGACGVRTENRNHRQRRRPKRPPHIYTNTHTHTRARARARPAPHRRRRQQHPQPTERPPARHQPPSDGRDDDDDDDAAAAAAGRRTVPSVSQSVYVARLRCAQTYHARQYVPRDCSLAGPSEILRNSLSLPRNSHYRNSTVNPRLIVLFHFLPRSLYLSVTRPCRPRTGDTFLSSHPNPRVSDERFFSDFYSVPHDFRRHTL